MGAPAARPARIGAAPFTRIAKFYLVVSAVGFGIVAALVAREGVSALRSGLLLFAFFGFYVSRFFYLGRAASAAQQTHAAAQALSRGRIREAEAHLDAVPAGLARRGQVMRAVAIQRATIAFYRGDVEAAARLLKPATVERTSVFERDFELLLRTKALSLRALVAAASGEQDRAAVDVVEVLASPDASVDAVARARLAQAVVLARAERIDALAGHLRTHGALILKHTSLRERVLARALRKLAQPHASGGVYRVAARPDAQPHALGSWIAQVAPNAAAFIEDANAMTERSEAPPGNAASPDAVPAVGQARALAGDTVPLRPQDAGGPGVRRHDEAARSARRRRARPLLAVAGVFFVVLFLLSSGSFDVPGDPWSSSGVLASTPMVLVTYALMIGAVLFIALTRHAARAATRGLLAATRLMETGDAAGAEDLLSKVERRASGVVAANVALIRAAEAEARANFEGCLASCDRGLSLIAAQSSVQRARAAFAETPALVGLRGATLAALGRADEAQADLATLTSMYVGWSGRAASEYRIRLLMAVRRGDLDAARAIARERTGELSIPLRDEVLGDLVLALTPGAPREEGERVDADLRDDPLLQTWIDAVAPGARADLARRIASGPRVDAEAPASASSVEDASDAGISQVARSSC